MVAETGPGFAAPSLIIHYVTAHGYKPSTEFQAPLAGGSNLNRVSVEGPSGSRSSSSEFSARTATRGHAGSRTRLIIVVSLIRAPPSLQNVGRRLFVLDHDHEKSRINALLRRELDYRMVTAVREGTFFDNAVI